LDDRYYGEIDKLQQRFKGVPSLSGCKELKIEGDVSFGDDVVCDGRVHLRAENPVTIHNRLLSGELKYD
jgi:hypothetical protein